MDIPLSLKYIESALQKGETEGQIRNKLRAQGIAEEQINKAFEQLKSKNDFLSSNVSGGQEPVSSAPPIPTRPTPSISFQRPDMEGRMKQIEPPKGSRFGVILTIIILVFLGAAAAGYYYFDDVAIIFYGEPAEESGIPSAGQPPEQPHVSQPTEPEPEPAPAPIESVAAVKSFAISYFEANGVYPESVEIADSDVFYCYRKNGTHFVAGTVLDPLAAESQEALVNDLDGNYYCGDTVKNCADPIYCVGP